MKKIKEKLEKEFWDFVALVTLFFICTVIFSVAKLVSLAVFCWILFLLTAVIYPIKWMMQFVLLLLKNKGKGE